MTSTNRGNNYFLEETITRLAVQGNGTYVGCVDLRGHLAKSATLEVQLDLSTYRWLISTEQASLV